MTKGYKTKWTKSTYKIIYKSKNGVYTLDNHKKYNANYLKRASGDEAPPTTKAKPGGVAAKLEKARAARFKTKYKPTKRITRAKKKG